MYDQVTRAINSICFAREKAKKRLELLTGEQLEIENIAKIGHDTKEQHTDNYFDELKKHIYEINFDPFLQEENTIFKIMEFL